MKIFGLHWAGHLLYLSALTGLGFYGKSSFTRAGFIKAELGQVQQQTLPVIRKFREIGNAEIDKYVYAFPNRQNDSTSLTTRRAIAWVTAFGSRCDTMRQQIRTGSTPGRMDWRSSLTDQYYALGDSLGALYGKDSALTGWLDRCLLEDYRDFSSDQLAGLLADSDTADAARICRNLTLKSELALQMMLSSTAKKLRLADIWYDGMTPVISYRECPRAGIPFRADVLLLPYSTNSRNVLVRVDGQPVPVEKGLAHYTARFKTPGPHTIRVNIQVRNPLTQEIRTYEKDFEIAMSYE